MIAVLVDANILVSFLLSNQPDGVISRALRAALRPGIRLIVPQELLDEVRDVCARKPYLRQRIASEKLDQWLKIVGDFGHIPAPLPPHISPSSRDPKDDYLLAYALAERVEYLVTGDEDLLVIGRMEGVQIVNPVEFLRLVGG